MVHIIVLDLETSSRSKWVIGLRYTKNGAYNCAFTRRFFLRYVLKLEHICLKRPTDPEDILFQVHNIAQQVTGQCLYSRLCFTIV